MRRSLRWMMVVASLLWVLPVRVQTENRAGLVLRYGDGRVATYCIRFGEASITGLDLLIRSGLQPVAETGGLGSAVCSISGEGCAYPSQPCFCRCQGANCAYWNYFHLIDGAWQYSPFGAANYTIGDGAIDGWSWGDQTAPPAYTIDQICAASSNSPTIPPTSESAGQPAGETPTLEPMVEPTIQPTREPLLDSTTQRISEPTTQPTGRPASRPTVQPANPPSASADGGSYAVFALAAMALIGWLIVGRARR